MASDKSVSVVLGWGVVTFLVVFTGILAFYAGAMLKAEQMPTAYAKGYCAALGGLPLNDETCNVAGKVVDVAR